MDHSEWDAVVEVGWSLKNECHKMLDYFSDLVNKFSDNARAHFEYANVLDYCDCESQAIPYYHHALDSGLEWPLNLFALIQLGSSLRNVGQYTDALSVLKQAYELKPDYSPTAIFYSLALFSAGKPKDALQQALHFILEQTPGQDRQRYIEPLQRYIADLD